MVKIIALGSIFIFSISSFLGVFSLNENIQTGFLIESLIQSVYASDDNDENEKDGDSDDRISMDDVMIKSDEEYTAPNGKSYSIHTIGNDFSFTRSNGTVSTITFKKKSDLIDYIKLNNQISANHQAPNGKVYSIVLDPKTGLTTFKRPDGTISSKTFNSSTDAIYFIDLNNKKEEKKIVKTKLPVVSVKKTVLKPSNPTTTVKPIITKPVVTQPPVITTPAPSTSPVYTAPKVDTTTRAS